MKRKLVLLVIAIVAAVTPATGFAAGKRVLKELAELPGVDYTYVSPAAMRFVDKVASVSNISGMSVKFNKMESLEVIMCDNADTIAKLKNLAKKLIRKNNLEIIIDNKSDDSHDAVYGIVPQDSDTTSVFSNLLIESNNKDSYTLLYAKGSISWAKMDDNSKNKQTN